jgi:type II secretory ATPase GspE/PulE/Tfp pilus assembly ATPase PilB-like protein
MKIEPFLLVSTIDIIIAQRLVRKLSEHKEKYFLSKAEISTLSKTVDLDRVLKALKDEKVIKNTESWDKIPFWKPITTKEDDGYKGRLGIHEVLKVTQSIKDLIIRGATTTEIEEQAKKEGMLTMIEDGIFNAVKGITTIEEVLRVVSE